MTTSGLLLTEGLKRQADSFGLQVKQWQLRWTIFDIFYHTSCYIYILILHHILYSIALVYQSLGEPKSTCPSYPNSSNNCHRCLPQVAPLCGDNWSMVISIFKVVVSGPPTMPFLTFGEDEPFARPRAMTFCEAACRLVVFNLGW